MVDKIEISIDVIMHATEDKKMIFESITENIGVEQEDFEMQHLTGHFENPILLAQTRITKKPAKKIMGVLVSKIPKEQIDDLVDDLENRIQNSTLYIRLDKQDLVQGLLTLNDSGAIKMKIHTPIYKKDEIIETYINLLKPKNDA